jgi:hypothetical protein
MHLFNIYRGDYGKAFYGNEDPGDADIYENLCYYFADIQAIKDYDDVGKILDTDEENEEAIEASWKIVRKQLNILKNLQ